MKNKSYIGISFIVLIFGLWSVRQLINRVESDNIIEYKGISLEPQNSESVLKKDFSLKNSADSVDKVLVDKENLSKNNILDFDKIFGLAVFVFFTFLLAKIISFSTGKSLKSSFKILSIVYSVLIFIGIIVAFLFANFHKSGINSNKSDLTVIGKAPKFSLTNQEGKIITNDDYKRKVYVVEFFFSTCPSICPIMNRNMKEVQASFASNANFGIASITINPENDTPAVLKEHAKAIDAKGMNWNFLTGDKETIFEIANKGYNLYVGENKKVNGGFEHSGLFALIDKEGNIRSRKDEFGNPIVYYDGLKEEGVKQIKHDISKLLAE